MFVIKIGYDSRKERVEYILKKYGRFLNGQILDVGCGDNYLKELVNSKCIGIDITGSPDIIVNLEQQKIPFKDNSFDCVVCTDVLEHLENIHEVFFELVRVTRKYIIISLPNNWNSVISEILKGKSNSKFYGLPTTKPNDRHKWFFNYDDAKDFIYNISKKSNIKIIKVESYSHFEQRKPLINLLVKVFLNKKRYNNIFSLALWVVLEK